ncbi:sialin-like [Ctenocephalides felis]|uniref:sialin-like n=1 Tax=Ctenocephalides felis TaxID=7515 RepID=UPI000E6E1488|nr:sialin-like [Ctenocephalides felis]
MFWGNWLKRQNIDHETPKPPPFTWKFWKQRRYLLSILAFFGFFNAYALRVNLSIAVVAMTNNDTKILENGTIVNIAPEFDWDKQTTGILLSAFFYGYIISQLPAGWLAIKFGGHRVFAIGILVTAIFTLVTPAIAKYNIYLLIAVRILEGIFEGVTFPCAHAVWTKWAPPLERSRLATVAFSGSYVGTVVSMPVCALIANRIGWEYIFYVFGIIGVLWFVLYWAIVKGKPEDDKYISKEELEYIQKSLGTFNISASNREKSLAPPPWKSILRSAPVWAIVASHFSENWGFYTLLTQLPSFLRDVLNFKLEKTGFMSALPYLAMAILLQFSGQLADRCQVKGWLTTSQVRRYFNCSAFIGQTIFLLLAGFILKPIGSMICLTVAVGLGAFAWSGFSVNHLDIAPQYASVLMGLSNTFATLPGIISPQLTGFIVNGKVGDDLLTSWQIVFYISSGIYLLGAVIYWFFASGEVQPWAKNLTNTNTSIKNDDYPNNINSNASKTSGAAGNGYYNEGLEM